MSKAVVLARPIKPEWLDRTVEMLSETRNEDEIRQGMNEYLSHFIKSSINVRKTREILMDIWVEVSSGNSEFRERALEVFKECSKSERTAIH